MLIGLGGGQRTIPTSHATVVMVLNGLMSHKESSRRVTWKDHMESSIEHLPMERQSDGQGHISDTNVK